MKNLFYNKLQEKIPHWQAQGWLDEISANNILNDALSDAKITAGNKSHKLSFILGVMGVMLLSAGTISFVAANWQGMSKLFKLSLLFSSMAGAYLAAAWALSKQKFEKQSEQNMMNKSGPRYPYLGQALLLLGVLLFGNNIMLIAQIYHIDSHYPNGILLWAAGALITAIIIRSEAVLIAASMLALLWSGMEIFDFRQIHWPWLIFWFMSAVIVIRQRAYLASHVIILSLFLWLLLSFDNFSRYAFDGYVIQLYLLLGIVLYLSACTIKPKKYGLFFVQQLSRYTLIFSLIFLYVLSFPDLELYRAHSYVNNTESPIIQMNWLFIVIPLMVFTMILCFYHLKQSKKTIPLYKWFGVLWLLVLFISLLLNNYFHQGSFYSEVNITVIIINLLLFTSVIGLIYFGLTEHKLFYVNMAFVVFTIVLISRYFDTFWSLMDRSLFFIIGGLILILGGYWLEKKRRQLSHQFNQKSHQQTKQNGVSSDT